jgi:predicted RNase H-like HicB family nuclease
LSTPRHFDSYTQARNQFRAVLDAARLGLVTTVTRDKERFVVIAADQLRDEFAALRPANAAVVAEGGGWAVIIPGLPVHGDGETFDEAVEDAVRALREYAEHRVVVELVEFSTDEQLREWLVGRPAAGPAVGPGQTTSPVPATDDLVPA